MNKNLFETYEVNGRQYTDNLPKNALISIPKKQYIEYEQQREENKKLHSIIKEAREYIDYWGIEPDRNDDKTLRYVLKDILEILDKVEEKQW